MAADAAAARGRGRAGDGGADRPVRAGEPGGAGAGVGGASAAGGVNGAAGLVAEAEGLLGEGRAGDALPVALRALRVLLEDDDDDDDGGRDATALPALTVVAAIYLELGDASSARQHLLEAVSLDPDGAVPEADGGGAEKFLWLAQLSEEGGQESVGWFERGVAVLRRGGRDKGAKLAGALCGIVEVYMTDLSWDPLAEGKCERLIAEALLAAPHSAEPLQTLASIRISQARTAEARQALRDSMALWQDVGPDDEAVPDFPTRVSLARLLMEVEMEAEALGVVERLVQEDDGSVEAWYLGGWCLYLLGGKQKASERNGTEDGHGGDEDLHTQSLASSREWLRQSLTLYELVAYEDERLREHAMELVAELDAIVGQGDDDEGEEEWDGFGDGSEDEQEDEEMDEG